MAEVTEEIHIQATFFTEKEKTNVPSTPFSLPLSATRDDLTQLLNQLISVSDDHSKVEFDFLINGSLLRKTLGELIETLQLKSESVIQIECIERSPPPSLDTEYPHNDWVSAVQCFEDYIVTGSYDSNIQIWSMDDSGECIARGLGHERGVSCVAWLPKSHDHHTLVSASHDQHARIWKYNEKAQEITCIAVCKGHSRIVEALDVSNDGDKFCTGGVDKVLKVWSSSVVEDCHGADDEEGEGTNKRARLQVEDKKIKTRVPLATFSGHTHPIMCIKWAADGIISAGYDHCMRQWDLATGVNTNVLNASKVFLSVDKSRDGHMIASGHTDRHVRLWDTRIASASLVTGLLSSHRGWVRRVCWSPSNDRQLVSGSYDNTAKLWDVRSPKVPLYTITAHEDRLLCLDWSVPKVIASGGSDNMLRTFKL